MANPLSGLTIRGRCLLASGVAAASSALILNERGLLRVAAFVIVLPLLFAVFAGIGRIRANVRRRTPPERLAVGQAGEIELLLCRNGAMPAGRLLLDEHVENALATTRPRFLLDRLPREGEVSLRYPVHPTSRGTHRLGPLRVTRTDMFGLTELDRQVGDRDTILVVPHTEPLHGMPSRAGAGAGGIGATARRTTQGDPDVIVRQYRHGDDLRKVHWRSTAHRDELMVRVEEQVFHGGTTVLLDQRLTAHPDHTGSGSTMEWAVSFAASACLHLRHAGEDVRLIGAKGEELAGLAGRGEPARDLELLDTLAELPPTRQRHITTNGAIGPHQHLLAVLGTLDDGSLHELSTQRPAHSGDLAVLLDGHHADRTVRAAGLLRAAGWVVVTADPRAGMADVWHDLCVRSAAGSAPAAGTAPTGSAR